MVYSLVGRRCHAPSTRPVNNDAFDILMKSAQRPGVFDLVVDYNNLYDYKNENNGEEDCSCCSSTCAATEDVDDDYKRWHRDRKPQNGSLYDDMFNQAMDNVEQLVFQEFDEGYRKNECHYPLHSLHDKMMFIRKNTKNKLQKNSTSTSTSRHTSRSATAAAGTAGAATFGSDKNKNINNKNIQPKPPELRIKKNPGDDARLCMLTAHFGSPPLPKCRQVNDEEDEFEEDDDDEEEEYYSLQINEDYSNDDNSIPIFSYSDRTAEDNFNNNNNMPIIGFTLTYSDGVQVEVGSLRGTICTAIAHFDDDEHIVTVVQISESYRNERKAYAVCMGVSTSKNFTYLFELGTKRIERGSIRRGQENEIPDKEQYPTTSGAFYVHGLEWSYEKCRIQSVVKKEMVPTLNSGPLKSGTTRRHSINMNHCCSQKQASSSSIRIESLVSLALKAIPKPKEILEKFVDKVVREAARDIREEYLDVLHCILHAAQSTLLNWLLEPRVAALQSLDYHEDILMKEYNHQLDQIWEQQKQAYQIRSTTKYKSLEGQLVQRYSTKFDQIRDKRKKVLQIRSDRERQALCKLTNKVIRGIKYHLQRLPPEFQKRLVSVEDELSREENRINAFLEDRQSKLAQVLYGNTNLVCKQRGCFEIFDPTLVPNQKQCSIPQCFSLSPPTNCGCSVMPCKSCLELLCAQHMASHEESCISTFPYRCGWKEGVSSLRHEQCGALLLDTLESRRKRCVECGVQCCDQCAVQCVGNPRVMEITYYIPLMGLPNPKSRPPQPCDTFWCLLCRDKHREMHYGQCDACFEKEYDDYSLRGEVTGYSDASMDDSNYKSNDSVSSDEEMVVDDDSSDGDETS